jgi:regulator of cell morphogenesis and NO signaling
MTATLDTRVSDIVREDFRAAAVLEHFGIDFCCGGRRTLADACRERRVNPLDVLIEVNQACERADAVTPRFAAWGPDALTAYIVRYHHAYVRRVLPAVVEHSKKVAASHGAGHPELHEIAALVARVADEMFAHMEKEERILFPYIEDLAMAAGQGSRPPRSCFGSVEHPLAVMEHEHDAAGEAMARIRELSNGYTVPQGACTTYAVLFRELEEFEHDLHVHVHLENNVLFPKARALDAAARSQAS